MGGLRRGSSGSCRAKGCVGGLWEESRCSQRLRAACESLGSGSSLGHWGGRAPVPAEGAVAERD